MPEDGCALIALNEALKCTGATPQQKRKAKRSMVYTKAKFRKVEEAVKKALDLGQEDGQLQQNDECEIIQQLKEKFAITTSRSEKVKILTVLPKSCSVLKITKEFSASNYMARQAKCLVTEKGILSSPNPRLGKPLLLETVEKVKLFEVSRQMPGKKDFVSVTTASGLREHVQKRLVLCNLKEAYQQFKTVHMNTKVGFSTFAQLQPQQCVLAGASATHSVCVCMTHQNVKLMFVGCGLQTLSKGEILDYHSCLGAIQCNPSRIQ